VNPPWDFDAIVIGTGFAGAVTACRLVQAGRRICVLERGRRYEADDFPIHPPERPGASGDGTVQETDEHVLPDFSRLSWRMGRGLWDVRDLGDLVAAGAAGYGGGSLIYANVHLRAPPEVFENGWPSPYSRARLDAYYDLAAYMLDVKPLPAGLEPAKTAQLRHAAGKLGRAGAFFLPPLAINFDDATKTHAGDRRANPESGRPRREQGTCNLCGGCCFGCQRQAKNTLDLNYLAIAEDAQRGDQPLAEVRTLCEVTAIRAVSYGPLQGYEVEYVDHVVGARGEPGRVRSPYVFLCAGAINTTELLLRSLERGHLAVTGQGLGDRYHPNADALAVVFDCDTAHEADRGPTIGGALLYTREEKGDGEGARRDWLMFQDGGMPGALEPLLGVFRSPLWAARNRHRDVAPDPRSRRQPPPRARLPIDSLTDVFAGLTRGALHPKLRFAHGINEQLLASLGRTPPDGTLSPDRPFRRWSLVPSQLRDALRAQRTEALQRFADFSEPTVARFLDRTAEQIEGSFDLAAFLRSIPLPGLDTAGLEQRDVVRKLVELAIQLLWGSEGDLVQAISSGILEAVVPEKEELAGRFVELLGWALDYRLGDGHTAVLLSMGRDSKPGRLSLTASARGAPALRVTLPAAGELPERAVQEQLLRDLAGPDAWRGELRTEPTWTLLGKRLSVHSQGGCPMGLVTGAGGQVEGCKGLYVMDAAAFPTPVGVNPSATITAIAEYKVERFLHETGDPGWTAPELATARAWASARRNSLDPIASLRTGPVAPPSRKPIGFRFREVMRGFHAPPRSGRKSVRELRSEELEGIGASQTIETDLTIEIADLARFLEQHRTGVRPRASITKGSVRLSGVPGVSADPLPLCHECGVESHLEFFSDHGSERNMRYRFHFHLGGEPCLLEGDKYIRDDEGFDVWEDTTRLFFEILGGSTGYVLRRGILRTPVSEFFGMQLPSFEVTHTDDPARQSWAFAAFGRFFFGNLLEVYVPELDRVVDVLKRIGERTHV
jgi:choline dehydrogenase-like flavoprotein